MNAEILEKSLIVNGSLNPSLSKEEILNNFSDEDVVKAANSISVKLNIYFNVSSDELPTYAEIKKTPIAKFGYLWDFLELKKEEKKIEVSKKEFKEGQDLQKAVFSIHTPEKMTVSLTSNQAKGYLSGISNWNDFDNKKVIKVVEEIEKLNIVSNYGNNNPNTGNEVLSYRMIGDEYFIMVVDLGGETLNDLKKIEPKIMTILNQMNADVVRYDDSEIINDPRIGNPYGKALYVCWWD